MKRILLHALIVVSGALLVLGIAGVGPAQAANYVGGLNLDTACSEQGNKAFARLVGTTAYDWRCVALNGSLVGINIPLACHNKYGPYTVDRIANFYDANSWQCWNTRNFAVPAGGLDLNSFCSWLNGGVPKTVGTTAYDWRCVAGGASAGINTTRACQNQYGGLAIDRFRNFYDRNSWECYI